MTRRLLLLLVLLVVAGCGDGGTNQAATTSTASTTTTTSTSTTTATTVKPTTTKPTNELGKVKRYVADDGINKSSVRVAVLAYSDNATLAAYRTPDDPRPGFKYVAVEIRMCAVSKNFPDPITVNWPPWSLNDDGGASYPPAGSYSPETLIGPLYPDGKATPIGTCRKGWLPFEVRTKWKPDYVEYSPEDTNTLTWRL